MAKTALVDQDIVVGAKLVEALDAEGWTPSVALWFFFPEDELWRLIVSAPLRSMPEPGQLDLYRRLSEIVEAQDFSQALSMDDLAVMPLDTPLFQLLGRAIQTGPGLSGIRFSHNVIDNLLIEDAYIYRINLARQPATT
jgi:hypothetical protein